MHSSAIYPSLADRPVFITGGGSGIGASLVTAFARQNAIVHFIDIDDTASRALVDRLTAESSAHRVSYSHCDIRDITALQGCIREFEAAHGPIRVLINNAANDDRHDWRDVSPDDWDERMAINLRPQFFAIQAAAPGMASAGGGSIINFGSISWKVGLGNMPGYTTAKAAVHGLTRSMARDLGGDHIRVNTVIPGAVLTQRQLEKWITPEDKTRLAEIQCLKQHLAPADVAPTVLFLAADDSAMCTAHEYFVDAGWG
ncbi:SDR family NAD(P)-dependent oxidoreductase [Salinisphaera sp. Q1T1-3]|uniref:SDR family NAD(P)-dependent oxidoreductase n=1 Tax=Salinisphaera sp. Q1T1-3 TaxID=2321229 RepID=UPI000E75C46E|nr:SDR family oxidoreductase [Salinisphaera sp. Q1T1-3]RJS92834.1 SDR family oxidoreductase [Salinisphaera sp. Q1T1-3]